MKNINSLILILGLFLVTGCELDNFDEPKSEFKGRFVYEGEALQLRGTAYDNDCMMYAYQEGPEYEDRGAINLFVNSDGEFNSLMYNGFYKIVLRQDRGPWIPRKDTIEVNIKGNQILDVEVTPYFLIKDTEIDFQNKGRVKIKDTTVTVKNGIPGQKVRFMINKKRGGRVEGRLLEVLKKSELEKRDPLCSIFPSCGGCMYQTMSYEHQLQMKAEQIKKLIDTAVMQSGQVDEHGNADYTFEGIKGSPQEFAYRNKMEFSFGDEYKDGPLSLGLHKKGSTYDVLNACDCKLVHEDMTKILTCVLEYLSLIHISEPTRP